MKVQVELRASIKLDIADKTTIEPYLKACDTNDYVTDRIDENNLYNYIINEISKKYGLDSTTMCLNEVYILSNESNDKYNGCVLYEE
jgi:hypothetical protein